MVQKLSDLSDGEKRYKLLPFNQTEVKAADSKDPDIAGYIEGYAAGILNIDRGSDIIFPGAFKADLPDFLAEGVVCFMHDWTIPIGRPLEAEEREEPEAGLFTRAEITATSTGADVMKLVKRSVLKKLSIGYRVKKNGYAVLNRESLAAVLKEREVSESKTVDILSDFDRRKLEEVYGLFDLTLFEYSVVTRPMNPQASITGVKQLDGSLLDGLPMSVHPFIVLDAVKGYAERVKESYEAYSKKDRVLSTTHKEGIQSIRAALEELLPDIKNLESLILSEKASPDEVLAELAKLQTMESRLNGVIIQ